MKGKMITMAINEKEKSLIEKLTQLRKEKKLSFEEISQKGMIPAPLVEQIEKGMVSPSIGALKKITKALEIPLSEFFQQVGLSEQDVVGLESEQKAALIRSDKRLRLDVKGSKAVIQFLTPIEMERNLELLWQEVEPKASGGDWLTHEGEECCLIISGSIRLYIEDEVYNLKRGDSLWFKTDQRHKWENPSDEPAVIIWAITPPYHGRI
jgi:transcriptional regulator with XRE-family HTH domain